MTPMSPTHGATFASSAPVMMIVQKNALTPNSYGSFSGASSDGGFEARGESTLIRRFG